MNISIEPSIDIIFGPMFSGKTTEIIRRLNIYHEMDMKVAYINSIQDRRSEKLFSSHNLSIGNVPFTAFKFARLDEIKIQDFDVIGIDESQLFENLKDTVLKWVEENGKIVIVGGLNGTFKRESFGEINDLIPYCDTVTKLAPFCTVCKNSRNVIKTAIFTRRISKSDSLVLIGGKDLYTSVCRKCFNQE